MVSVLLRNPANALEGLGRVGVAAAVCFHVAGPRAFATMDWASSGRNEDGVTIGRWLEFELPPGEAVQPLDIVQGAVAVRNGRIHPVTFAEVTPGIRNADAVAHLARLLHPERF